MSLAIDNHPGCMICRDTGITHTPDYPPTYRFCGCPAGLRRRESDPKAVDDANAAEERLARIGANG